MTQEIEKVWNFSLVAFVLTRGVTGSDTNRIWHLPYPYPLAKSRYEYRCLVGKKYYLYLLIQELDTDWIWWWIWITYDTDKDTHTRDMDCILFRRLYLKTLPSFDFFFYFITEETNLIYHAKCMWPQFIILATFNLQCYALNKISV